MNPLTALRAFLAGFGSGGGTNPITVDDIVPFIEQVITALAVMQDVFNAADDNARKSVTAATDAAAQIETIGNDLKWLTDHTYKTVLPHSLSYLLGYIVSHYIGPIESHLTRLDHQIAFLMGWRSQIDTWRHRFVDPHIIEWEGFHRWFVGWPQGVLFRWRDWFAHPADFGKWAAVPVTGPIIGYLTQSAGKGERDKLSLLLVRAWRDEPENVWQAMQAWVLTGK